MVFWLDSRLWRDLIALSIYATGPLQRDYSSRQVSSLYFDVWLNWCGSIGVVFWGDRNCTSHTNGGFFNRSGILTVNVFRPGSPILSSSASTFRSA